MSIDPRLAAALSGRYRLERELGAGGMATVYLAQDQRHARSVAIKVLHPEAAASVGAERFLAEIHTTAKLSHPNVLPLFDSGTDDGFFYFVMPLVIGESRRARRERERVRSRHGGNRSAGLRRLLRVQVLMVERRRPGSGPDRRSHPSHTPEPTRIAIGRRARGQRVLNQEKV